MAADSRPTRLRKAWDDTDWWRWKREITIGLVSGLLAFVALQIFSSSQSAMDELIVVLVSVGGAMVLLPLLEFGWNWLQAPMRLLTDDVLALRREVAELPREFPTPAANPSRVPEAKQRPPQRQGMSDSQYQAITARLEILRRLEEELRQIERALQKALERGYSYGTRPTTYTWDALRPKLGGIKEWQELYETLRDTHETLSELSWVSGELGDKRSSYEEALVATTYALNLINEEIKRLAAL